MVSLLKGPSNDDERYMLLVYGLRGIAAVGWNQAQQPAALHVALGRNDGTVISRQIGLPSRLPQVIISMLPRPIGGIANPAVGELKPDVYISSDANVMELVMVRRITTGLVGTAHFALKNGDPPQPAKPLQQRF